ncbi:MAG: hypothetical protein NT027_20160, partial [Proteobacteria bacterium]|nr:hypothetical protein [Pseudomonadota bacterium]
SLHGPLFLDGDIPDQESGLQKARVLRKIKRQATTSLQYLQFISMQVRTIHSLSGNGFESIYPSNNLDRIKKSFICGTPPPCFV